VSVAPFSMTQTRLPGGGDGPVAVAYISSRPDILWAAYGSSVDEVTGDGWVSLATPIPTSSSGGAVTSHK
jgi:hypothetical protein